MLNWVAEGEVNGVAQDDITVTVTVSQDLHATFVPNFRKAVYLRKAVSKISRTLVSLAIWIRFESRVIYDHHGYC
jgi:hypothetical protein